MMSGSGAPGVVSVQATAQRRLQHPTCITWIGTPRPDFTTIAWELERPCAALCSHLRKYKLCNVLKQHEENLEDVMVYFKGKWLSQHYFPSRNTVRHRCLEAGAAARYIMQEATADTVGILIFLNYIATSAGSYSMRDQALDICFSFIASISSPEYNL